MKHLRSDYDGIQPWPVKRPHVEKDIPDDEPVFLIRAKDPTAPQVVTFWADLAAAYGADPELCERVRQWATAMSAYRMEHYPLKEFPDVPDGALR